MKISLVLLVDEEVTFSQQLPSKKMKLEEDEHTNSAKNDGCDDNDDLTILNQIKRVSVSNMRITLDFPTNPSKSKSKFAALWEDTKIPAEDKQPLPSATEEQQNDPTPKKVLNFEAVLPDSKEKVFLAKQDGNDFFFLI